jgi:hypothetical protein
MFQPMMKSRILPVRSLTERKVPAADGLAFDDAEPDLDQDQPGSERRGQVGVDP